MLNRCENEVMSAVYCLCDGTDGCLISPLDIMSILPAGRKYSVQRLDDALLSLQSDGYLNVIPSERKGEKMYVISLKESGLSFKRTQKQKRLDVINKIALAFVGAVATFVFGLILKAIFHV
ncbi:MAG: hypothetical protein NC033_05450 [Clostridiales bacterium]|nr:hypothetical protein [Clostridiales bacterium]